MFTSTSGLEPASARKLRHFVAGVVPLSYTDTLIWKAYKTEPHPAARSLTRAMRCCQTYVHTFKKSTHTVSYTHLTLPTNREV